MWNPNDVPNNGGGNVYDVTIARDPNGADFNDPQLDIDVTIRNLAFINRGFLTNSDLPHNLTVIGNTSLSTTAGHDGEYGGLFASGTYKLGTLTNYTASTHTLEAGDLGAVVLPVIRDEEGAEAIRSQEPLAAGDVIECAGENFFGSDDVILSDFQAVPEPSTWAMMLGWLGVLACWQPTPCGGATH